MSKFNVKDLSDLTKLPFYDKNRSCPEHPSADINEGSIGLVDFTVCSSCKQIITKSKRKLELHPIRERDIEIFDALEYMQELV